MTKDKDYSYYFLDMQMPLGIRQHNPGNLRASNIAWNGLYKKQDPRIKKEFCVFKDPFYGVRAMAIVLLNYQQRYNCQTIASIISRYAPDCENNTTAYIDHMQSHCGVNASAPMSLINNKILFNSLIKGMIYHENGMMPYDSDMLYQAVDTAIKYIETKKKEKK